MRPEAPETMTVDLAMAADDTSHGVAKHDRVWSAAAMDFVFVTPEIAPFSGSGATAEVSAALPKAVRSLGHRVTVVTPLLASIDPAERSLARRLSKLDVRIGGKEHVLDVYDGRTAAGLDLIFLGHDELIRPAARLDAEGADAVVARRVGLFAAAVARVIETREITHDVLHVKDWPGALVLLSSDITVPTVLTVQDVAAQGVFDRSLASDLGLSAEGLRASQQGGRLNILAGGLRRASHVTTVSAALARNATTPRSGRGLEEVFAGLGDRLTGIPSGVDVSVWNPATDARLASRFDPVSLTGKSRCKADLQHRHGLPIRPEAPLLGAIARPGETAGFDALAKVCRELLRNDCQLVIAFDGPTEDPLFGAFADLSTRFGDRLQIRPADEDGIHRLFGAADVFVVPSREDLGGLDPMIAQRYGAVPIVHRVGGLADAVVDCDAELSTGSGFTYDSASTEELLAALRRAVGAAYMAERFEALRRRVMRLDCSWERGARIYERIFRDLALSVD